MACYLLKKIVRQSLADMWFSAGSRALQVTLTTEFNLVDAVELAELIARTRDRRAVTQEMLRLLTGSGALSAEKSSRAVTAAAKTGEPLETVLVQLGVAPPPVVYRALAQACGLTFISAEQLRLGSSSQEVLNRDFMRAQLVLPISTETDSLTIAISDPFRHEALEGIRFKTGKVIRLVMAEPAQIEAALDGLPNEAGSDATVKSHVDDALSERDIERIRELAAGAPVIRWTDAIFEEAVLDGASDIHLDHYDGGMRVRFRIDGRLQDRPAPLHLDPDAIASRIKVLATLNISEKRLPQDGRLRREIKGREIDFRVATTPMLHGEGLVIRILDRSAGVIDLDDLGMSPRILGDLRSAVRRPNGITLVTGPTGSGKTTTLYASIRDILTPELKFVSVEDPVEFEIQGVTQIPVRPSIGLSFSRALRSILRQDPDIIMIGEIRDRETAMIAIEAALTGHRVLSTLHTNNAPATITRLLEMDVPAYLISSTLSAVFAQRLVRRICQSCTTNHALDEQTAMLFAQCDLEPPSHVSRGSGCPDCRGSGYRGRISISEGLVVTPELKSTILSTSNEGELRALARQAGNRSLLADGLAQAARGVTTIEEVIMVAGLASDD